MKVVWFRFLLLFLSKVKSLCYKTNKQANQQGNKQANKQINKQTIQITLAKSNKYKIILGSHERRKSTNLLPQIPQDSQPGKCNLFQVCLEAESTLPTFQHYRDKEIFLRKLIYSTSYHKSLPEFYHDLIPRFLIGQLYVNFSPIWQSVMEILKSHAHGQDVKTFWVVFHEHLELAATNAGKELKKKLTYIF